MIINKQKCIDAATVAVPFLIGVIVGKLGLKEQPKEAQVTVDSEESSTEATEEKKES